MSRSFYRLLALLAAAMAFLSAGAAQACTTTTVGPANFGPFSPQSIKLAKVPAQTSPTGLRCQTPLILLLSNNYIRGKLHSQNNLRLVNGANSIAYTASADPAGSAVFTQDGTVDYMQNNLLELLGLLGSNADLPISIKPTGVTQPNGALPPAGVYTDKITMTWSYYVCTINVAGVCGGLRQGTNVTTTLDIRLTVSLRSITLTTSTGTTWDPVNLTTNPKALPGGRRRLIVALTNPDIVPVDNNALGVNLAIPAGTIVALDGDGTSTPAFVKFADGTPASTLALSYASPSSTTDDVDFSADRGFTWTYVPVAGDDVSQGAVTNVRLRPRGAMAAGSQFTASISLKTK